MIKKRAIPYFLLMAFPMGIGAGAANWISLPRIPLPQVFSSATEESPVQEVVPIQGHMAANPFNSLPDFSAVHPLIVGALSLLICTGVLLAADKPRQ